MIDTMTPQDAEIRDFTLARIGEDADRDRHRKFLRDYRLRVTADRHRAIAAAADWIDSGHAAAAGRDWLRRVARHWRRHPDYRHEWRP